MDIYTYNNKLEQHENKAVDCALDIQRNMEVLNDELVEKGIKPVKIGIGINTGYAVIGNMGSEKRFDYTAIGDAVNVGARLESGTMAFPFQFYNFAFAANQRITRAMFDPNKKYRLSGAIALLSMAYITLAMRKPSWWFENKDYPELMMRLVDYSGITGIYSDLAYKGIEAAIASGYHDPDTSWLKGRYNGTGWDSAFGFLGATPSMYREWVLAAYELMNDKSDERLKRLSYNFPYPCL